MLGKKEIKIMANQTFEKAMNKLEKIVQELESTDLPLEKAIKKFEEGVQLSKFCSEKLDETEKKITILLKDQNDRVYDKPFISESKSDNE
jgi:exodeoxyribonuclease VII small subunit